MFWGAASGALELRAESGTVRLVGRFPYGTQAELAPGRFERIEPRAFAGRIEAEGQEIHFLVAHDYDRPLASRAAGSLIIRDIGDAVQIEAQIEESTSWARDLLAAHRAGLIRGLSPGFRVPEGGARITRQGNGILRAIMQADLFELSAVTRPAYDEGQIEARAWNPSPRAATDRTALHRTLRRWRA